MSTKGILLEIINLFVFTTFTWYASDINDTQLHNSAAYISVMITFILLAVVIRMPIPGYAAQ